MFKKYYTGNRCLVLAPQLSTSVIHYSALPTFSCPRFGCLCGLPWISNCHIETTCPKNNRSSREWQLAPKNYALSVKSYLAIQHYRPLRIRVLAREIPAYRPNATATTLVAATMKVPIRINDYEASKIK